MSDPLNIVFHSPTCRSISPMVYLHWGGECAYEYLVAALPRLRTGDVAYACARFIGYCHEQIQGTNSLGVSNLILRRSEEISEIGYEQIVNDLAKNDILLVNVDTWTTERNGRRGQLDKQSAGRSDGFNRAPEPAKSAEPLPEKPPEVKYHEGEIPF